MRVYEEGINIDEMISRSKICILQFGSSNCAPCVAIKHRIEIYARDKDISTLYIDVDRYVDIALRYNVFTSPSVLVYVCGKLSIDRRGYFSLDEILSSVDRYLAIMD